MNTNKGSHKQSKKHTSVTNVYFAPELLDNPLILLEISQQSLGYNDLENKAPDNWLPWQHGICPLSLFLCTVEIDIYFNRRGHSSSDSDTRGECNTCDNSSEVRSFGKYFIGRQRYIFFKSKCK